MNHCESTWTVDRTQATSSAGMVAAKTPQAARAGAQVLRNGGNAVDAAVVTALVAGVAEPWMNGLGGGGYLIRHDSATSQTDVVAYPMVAPASAYESMFELAGTGTDAALFGWPSVVGAANIVGHRAVCVPGTVSGLSTALARFGSLSWATALEPAIDLADRGLPVTWHTTMEIARDLGNLRKFPATEAILCPAGVVPWSVGESNPAVIRNPDLADTLRALANDGPRSFYEGAIASHIVTHMNEGGAMYSDADLASYEARIESPLTVTYRGTDVHTLDHGSGGPTLAESLRLCESMLPDNYSSADPAALHLMAQAFAASFADRFAYLADPEFVDCPIEALLSDHYIGSRASSILPDKVSSVMAGPREQLGVRHDLAPSIPDYSSGGSTTHLSVIDKDGVAVTLTQTLLSLWGSRVTIPGTGVIMNNGMMWFDPEPGRPNSIAGRKRPLSNMAPVLLVRNGQSVAALGASGGRRIMNCVAQIALNLIDHKMEMQQAVSAPRIDRSTMKLIASSRMDHETVDAMRAMGHDLALSDESLFFGDLSSPACVAFADGTFHSGVDPFYYPSTASGV
ncbi:gamma-glutamyltransferase [soil metagenome]